MVIKLKIYSVNAMLSFPADSECLFDSSGQFQEDRLQINTKSCHVGNEKTGKVRHIKYRDKSQKLESSDKRKRKASIKFKHTN